MDRQIRASAFAAAEASWSSSASCATAIHVVSNTWARTCHDLYDFETQQVHTKSLTVPVSTSLLRHGNEVLTHDVCEPPPVDCEPLLLLVSDGDRFLVDRLSSGARRFWRVVRDSAGGRYPLSAGDIIKLGRFKFRVRQLVASADGSGGGAVQPELRFEQAAHACRANFDSNATCRICLIDGPGEDDPLIAPCACKGSIESVHVGCLRHWINGRLNLQGSSPERAYFYRPLTCELCKKAYPTDVVIEEAKTPLVQVPRTQAPFIVLENMARDHAQHSSRGLHVVSLAEKFLKIGRGNENDVRIADVSISRCHATIRFDQGQFLLEDNRSKFGTSVAVQRPLLLQHGEATEIQVGRTVLSLSVQAAACASDGREPGLASASFSGSCSQNDELAPLGDEVVASSASPPSA